MPLHDIHLEEHGNITGYIASSINRGSCNYLLFIHEMLFHFFDSKSEHTFQAHAKPLQDKPYQENVLKNSFLKLFTVKNYYTEVVTSSVKDYSSEYSSGESTNTEEFQGFHYLHSGLSPPTL
jgi:hypothetical protein